MLILIDCTVIISACVYLNTTLVNVNHFLLQIGNKHIINLNTTLVNVNLNATIRCMTEQTNLNTTLVNVNRSPLGSFTTILAFKYNSC